MGRINGRTWAARREENIERLRKVRDAREEGNLLPVKPERISAAVPVLVQAVNACRDGVGESQLPRDVRAALAANFHQIAGILLLRRGNLKKPLHAIEERHARGDVRQRIVQAFPANARPIGRFHVALGANLVRIQYVEQPRGIAAASRVLQKQGIVEIGLILHRKADLARDAHPDDAGADGMSHRLAFGQVERIGKRRDDFG